MLLQQREADQDSCEERPDVGARGPKRENDSVEAIGSEEVCRVSRESNAMDSTRVVEFDPRVLRESKQMAIDFVNQLDVICKRPSQWASSFPLFQRNVWT